MVVAFDFDGTLTNKDTLFGFFLYAKTSFRFLKIMLYIIAMLLTKCKIIRNSNLKSIGIFLFLKGKPRSEVEMLGKNYAKSISLNDIYYQYYVKENNAWILSASFYEYLQFIFPEQTIIASRLKYDDNELVKGLDFNCYMDIKLIAIRDKNINHIDIFYTDSLESDKSIIEFAEKVFLVNRGNIVKQIK